MGVGMLDEKGGQEGIGKGAGEDRDRPAMPKPRKRLAAGSNPSWGEWEEGGRKRSRQEGTRQRLSKLVVRRGVRAVVRGVAGHTHILCHGVWCHRLWLGGRWGL